jgi:putative transcriptional regulator
MIEKQISDEAALAELGHRLEHSRLQANWTQAELAREAGLSKSTVERLEAGEAIRTNSLVRVLRVLNLLNNIDALVPEPAPSPIQQLKLQGQQRKRASSPRSPSARKPRQDNGGWTWGDEQ